MAARHLFCSVLVVGVTTAIEEESKPSETCHETQTTVDRYPAYHYQAIVFDGCGNFEEPSNVRRTVEVWVVRGLGRRIETRVQGKLVNLTVETPRWRFVWDVQQNHVVAWASDTEAGLDDADAMILMTREETICRTKRLKGTYVSEKEVRKGREVEKATFRYLADPLKDASQPIHVYDAARHERLLRSPDATFRNRVCWFDIKTGRRLGYRCGCETPKYEVSVDYRSPESLPQNLFIFHTPRDATMEVCDPALGRRLQSQGLRGPDLRQ